MIYFKALVRINKSVKLLLSTGPPTRYTYRSCSAMETDAMELAVHSFSADVNGNGVLELHGY